MQSSSTPGSTPDPALTPPSRQTPDPVLTGNRLAHGFKRTFFGFSPSFVANVQGNRYGYLFPKTSSIPFSEDNRKLLERLGRSMIDATNNQDPSEFSNIDAGYTYLGQFLDHDMTLDVDSKMSKSQDAHKLINYRSPNFDLDSLYGAGPGVSPYMYEADQLKLVVGSSNIFDLPRTMAGVAIIGDPRNDENLFVAQFHMSMIHFHNAVIDQLRQEAPGLDPDVLFIEAQKQVRRHYQWIIINDFLPTILGNEIMDDIKKNGPKIFSKDKVKSFIMPVEFSVAAYRFGHSMVRNNYHFNAAMGDQDFMQAFNFTKNKNPVTRAWVIDWSSFFSEPDRPAINKARKIDTRVAFSMSQLPLAPGAPPDTYFTVLSARNLIRSMALQVPTGQSVASEMGEQPLMDLQQNTGQIFKQHVEVAYYNSRKGKDSLTMNVAVDDCTKFQYIQRPPV